MGSFQQLWIDSSIATAIYKSHGLQKPKRVLVFIHGWGGCKTERDYAHVKLARQLCLLTQTVSVLFDCKGHGESLGDFSEVTYRTMLNDTLSVLEWVSEQYPASDVYLLTSAFGARIALDITEIQNERPSIRGICMLSPALVIPKILLGLPDRWNEQFFNDQAIREATTLMGGLPDHIRGETIQAGWMKESKVFQIPNNLSSTPILLVCDPDNHSPETVDLMEVVDHSFECQGGGAMFRKPELLQVIGDKVANWIVKIERLENASDE